MLRIMLHYRTMLEKFSLQSGIQIVILPKK